jgi:dephospho-CoA kinase
MRTEIIVGLAGSGKSTYLKRFRDENVIYHDVWAKEFYKSAQASRVIKKYMAIEIFTKEDLITLLITNPEFHREYTIVGKECFIEYIAERLNYDDIAAIEIPFLHESFTTLKEQFDIEVVLIKRDAFDCLDTLINDRGWSKARINMTLPHQVENYIDHYQIIDRYVDSRSVI